MNVLIADEETERRIRMLAEAKGTTLTNAVNDAVRAKLIEMGLEAHDVKEGAAQVVLSVEMRNMTRDYVKFLEKINGKPSGSRVYQMLARHGAAETLRRIIAKPTSGFDFLVANDGVELAFENLAVDPRFESIVDPETRRIAKERLG